MTFLTSFGYRIGRPANNAALAAVSAVCLALTLSVSIEAQTPVDSTNWTHVTVCEAGLQHAAFDLVKRRLEADSKSGERPCVQPADIRARVESLTKSSSCAPVSVLVDRPTFTELLNTNRQWLKDQRLFPLDVQLIARPLYVFGPQPRPGRPPESAAVGILQDQEIDTERIRSVVSQLVFNPTITSVVFQSLAELAKCLAAGDTAKQTEAKCSQKIDWAAFLDRDAFPVVGAFRSDLAAESKRWNRPPPEEVRPEPLASSVEFRRADSAPSNLSPEGFIAVDAGGIATIDQDPKSTVNACRGPAVDSARGPAPKAVTALMRRSLEDDAAQAKAPANRGVLATFLSFLSPKVSAASASPAAPSLPLLLVNDGFGALAETTVNAVRRDLSDGYVSALAETYAEARDELSFSPCLATVERVHRAYTLNAFLDDKQSLPKRYSLGSGLLLNRPEDDAMRRLFEQLKIGDINSWMAPEASTTAAPRCDAVGPDEVPVRDLYSNPDLTFHYRALKHLRLALAAHAGSKERNDSVRAAAACLRLAVAKDRKPNCFKSSRATYHVYYDPYLYFAADQALGRDRR